MSRNRKRKRHASEVPAAPNAPRAGAPQPDNIVQATIGMISVKTIRTRTGEVILRQGERIRQEILTEYSEEEVVREILANAMPGKEPEQ